MIVKLVFVFLYLTLMFSMPASAQGCHDLELYRISENKFLLNNDGVTHEIYTPNRIEDGSWSANNEYILFYGLSNFMSSKNPQLSLLSVFYISHSRKPVYKITFGAGIRNAFFVKGGEIYVSESSEYSVDIKSKKITYMGYSDPPPSENCPVKYIGK